MTSRTCSRPRSRPATTPCATDSSSATTCSPTSTASSCAKRSTCWFSRYFSPRQHNRPESLEALPKLNDLELFGLEADPDEMTNLALDPRKHGELMLAMNATLNRLIESEFGEDVGHMLPGGVDAGWVATPAVNEM